MSKEILGEYIIVKNANKDFWYGREHIGQVYRVTGGNEYCYIVRNGCLEERVLIDDVERLTPFYIFQGFKTDRLKDEMKEFTKADLRIDMEVTIRDGRKLIFVGGGFRIGDSEWGYFLGDWENDLTHCVHRYMDIIELCPPESEQGHGYWVSGNDRDEILDKLEKVVSLGLWTGDYGRDEYQKRLARFDAMFIL